MVAACPEMPNLAEPRRRLNVVCPYYTMFPLEFPLAAIQRGPRGSVVLDPFCGRGTTLYAARLLGHRAVGIDINPVAAAIASAKLASGSSTAVIRRASKLIEVNRGHAVIPEGEFWDLGYERRTLGDIVALRTGLLGSRNDGVTTLIRAVALGVLHGPVLKGKPSYWSNQMPRTYATKPAGAVRYWKRQGLAPAHVDVLDVLSRRAQYLLADAPSAMGGRVLLGDARTALQGPRRFSLTVTSPPYLGMRTYLPDQWLRAWFLGGEPSPGVSPCQEHRNGS